MFRFVPLLFVALAFYGSVLPTFAVSYSASDNSPASQATIKIMDALQAKEGPSPNAWNYVRGKYETGPTGVMTTLAIVLGIFAAAGAFLYYRRWLAVSMSVVAFLNVALYVLLISRAPEFRVRTSNGITVAGVAGPGYRFMMLAGLGLLITSVYFAIRPQSKTSTIEVPDAVPAV